MFDHGIRWSGLIVKLCGCDVQALQMNLRWMRQLMVLSVLAKLQTRLRLRRSQG
jgi:hypothetical protein